MRGYMQLHVQITLQCWAKYFKQIHRSSSLRVSSPASIEPCDDPLHVVALYGHREFAQVATDQNPGLAREKNDKGFYPIHLPSSKGHLAIDLDFLDSDAFNGLCFLKDVEGRTPLHLAAIKEQMEVVRVLLMHCPGSAKEVTFKKETVLHLVVKYNLCEVIELLLSLLDHHNLHHNLLDELVNCKDEGGNTMLHLAAGLMLKILSRNTKVDYLDESQHGSYNVCQMTHSSQPGILNDLQPSTSERLTLDSIVVQYLKHQHCHCPAPITTLPPFSLLQPHVRLEPKRSLDAPSYVTARIGTRELKSIYGPHGNRKDCQFVYSRFQPWRTCWDDACALFTCMDFLGIPIIWLLVATQTSSKFLAPTATVYLIAAQAIKVKTLS